MSGLPPDPTASGGTNLDLEVSVTAPAPTLPVPAQAQTQDGGPQWLRRWSLTVYGLAGAATSVLELSAGQESALGGPPSTNPQGQPLAEGLRIKFRTISLDANIPNHAEIYVYNVSDETASKVVNGEFYGVVLQAGYATGKYGAIFQGTIKQVKRGRESAVDSYIIIYASDGDLVLTQTVLEPIALPRGSAAQDQIHAIAQQWKDKGISMGPTAGLEGGVLNRSKTIWNSSGLALDTPSKPTAQWSIQKGVLQVVPINGYLPGEAVVLNVRTGLIGVPEANIIGVFAVALLNPAIKVGGLIKINNGDVNTKLPAISGTTVLPPGNLPAAFGGGTVSGQGYPGFSDFQNIFQASTAADGVYKVKYLDYTGDTRGNDWYVHIMCLLVDQSSNEVTPGNNLVTGLGPPSGATPSTELPTPPPLLPPGQLPEVPGPF